MLLRRDDEHVPGALSSTGDANHHGGDEETVCRARLPMGLLAERTTLPLPGRAPGSQHGSGEGDPDRADGRLGSVPPAGGNTPEALQSAKLILRKGNCSGHARFSGEQTAAARAKYPGINIIVHLECRMEVVQAVDCDGSSEFIIDTITGRDDPGS